MKTSFAAILKFDEGKHPRDEEGQFAPAKGGRKKRPKEELPKEVYIEEDPVRKVIYVRYAQRGKHQKHMAGQFDTRDGMTREQVEQWVKGQGKLTLVPHG